MKFRNPFLSWVILAAWGLLGPGCTYNDAELHCQREGGFTGNTLHACIQGSTEIAPQNPTLEEADRDCEALFTKACSLTPRSVPGQSNCRDHDLSQLAEVPGTQAWADRSNTLIGEYSACHAGVLAHFTLIGPGRRESNRN